MAELTVETKTQFEIVDITSDVAAVVKDSGVKEGVAVIFAPHTTAAIRLNNFEPLLIQDIMKMLYRTAPVDINYSHDLFEIRAQLQPDERSNGHAHVKSFLLGASESVPVVDGELALGERQSIFFVELDGGRKRRVVVQVLGE